MNQAQLARFTDLLPKVDPNQLQARLEAEHLRRSFSSFQKAAWKIKHPTRKLIWGWHHEAKAEHLEACKAGEILRLVINIPPRTLKSETVSVDFPAYWWTTDPTKQFLAASADKDVVYRDADALRDLCSTDWYQETFRPQWGFRADKGTRQQDAKGYYRNTAGGHRISKTMGAKGIGNNADVLIIDDPLDPTDAFTDKAELVRHVIHFKQKLITRLNDDDVGVVIVIMQRLHELDLSGILLEEGGWEHLYLPAEFDGIRKVSSIGWRDPRTKKGELLDPVRLPAERLKQKKIDLGARGYAGQFEQIPKPAGGAMVLKDWLLFWTPKTVPDFDYLISSWDFTFHKTVDSDFVAGQVWGVSGVDRYLLDQAHAKMNPPDMIAAIREQQRIWPDIMNTIIEDAAEGKNVARTVMREVNGVELFPPKGKSKQERLAATLPYWEQGHIYLPHPRLCSINGLDYSWVQSLYMPELLGFPGTAHDDQVDATSQALLWIEENGPGDTILVVLGSDKK